MNNGPTRDWLSGYWSPSKDEEDLWHREWEIRSGRTRGLTLVAAWIRQHGSGIVASYSQSAAARYLGVISREESE